MAHNTNARGYGKILSHNFSEGQMRSSLLVLFFLGLSACAPTSDVMRTDGISRAPISESLVQVYLDEPEFIYTTIGIVKVSDQGWDRSLEELKQIVVKEAAQLGGDGVVVGIQSQSAGTAFVPIGNMLYAVDSQEKVLVGKVILRLRNIP